MASRKTFDVETFKNKINERLATDLSDEVKAELCCVLEEVLFYTNNYRGFSDNYWRKQGCREWERDGRPENKNIYLYGPSGQKYSRQYN